MIAVPDATVLPRTRRPIAASNAEMISSGKPWGYAGKARSNCRPAISQCPVVVSFPPGSLLHPAVHRPTYPGGAARLPRESSCRFQPLQIRQPQPAHGFCGVCQRVTAGVPILVGVRCFSDADAVQDHDDGPFEASLQLMPPLRSCSFSAFVTHLANRIVCLQAWSGEEDLAKRIL